MDEGPWICRRGLRSLQSLLRRSRRNRRMDSLLQTSRLRFYSIQLEEDDLDHQAQSPLPMILIYQIFAVELAGHCDEIQRDLPRRFSMTPNLAAAQIFQSPGLIFCVRTRVALHKFIKFVFEDPGHSTSSAIMTTVEKIKASRV